MSDSMVAAPEATDESRSFERRIEPLVPQLLGYFLARVTPGEDAADCLSELVLVMWKKRRRLPVDEQGLRSWAFAAARHVLANHRRSRLRQNALADRLRTEIQAVAPHEHNHDDGEILQVLDLLSATDRELLQLIAWDGFGVAEAGEVLGMRAGTARSRYSRARATLRAALAAADIR